MKKFYPFFRIYTSYNVQKVEYDVPYLVIDILTLLIEKGRLLGRSIPLEEIQEHIQKTLLEMYPDIEFDGQEVTRSILGTLEADTKGLLYEYEYYNPISQKKVNEYIQLVEYDVKEGSYRITDTGLDFMISTKELPEESKISVSLILFKKQIESGSFRSALGTIRDLNLAVQLRKRKKEELLENLINGGTDVVEDFDRYSKDVLAQLKHENELFTQVNLLLKNLSENRDKIAFNPEFSGKEGEFIIIKRIAEEVEHGYKIHNNLLKEFTDFPEEYERINRIRLNSLFERRYQFQEALENHIRANLSNEIHIVTIHPLFNARVPKTFNLLKIFEPQIIANRTIDISETRSSEDWPGKVGIEDIVGARQIENFKIFATILLSALARKKRIHLAEYLDYMTDALGEDSLKNVDFIPFLFELNSNTEIHFSKNDTDGNKQLNPFENIFYLSTLRNPDVYRDQIEEALYFACEKTSVNGSMLRIISQPNTHVNFGGNGDIYVSDMIFIVE